MQNPARWAPQVPNTVTQPKRTSLLNDAEFALLLLANTWQIDLAGLTILLLVFFAMAMSTPYATL